MPSYHSCKESPNTAATNNIKSQHIDLERHVGQCGNSPATKKQGIARQERCDHQPRFAENNQKQYGIRPPYDIPALYNHILIDMGE